MLCFQKIIYVWRFGYFFFIYVLCSNFVIRFGGIRCFFRYEYKKVLRGYRNVLLKECELFREWGKG